MNETKYLKMGDNIIENLNTQTEMVKEHNLFNVT